MYGLEANIGYSFKNKALIFRAITHSSIKSSNNKFDQMEFLGDRVLNLIIASIVSRKYAGLKTGELSNIFSFLVSYKTCCLVAIDINLPRYIRTSLKHLKTNESVLADAMEAIVAAIFLDSNYDTSYNVVSMLWEKYVNSINVDCINPKGRLQEITQSINNSLPVYETISIDGPSHMQEFSVRVTALGKEAVGFGESKKIAEISAASKMIEILQWNE